MERSDLLHSYTAVVHGQEVVVKRYREGVSYLDGDDSHLLSSEVQGLPARTWLKHGALSVDLTFTEEPRDGKEKPVKPVDMTDCVMD